MIWMARNRQLHAALQGCGVTQVSNYDAQAESPWRALSTSPSIDSKRSMQLSVREPNDPGWDGVSV